MANDEEVYDGGMEPLRNEHSDDLDSLMMEPLSKMSVPYVLTIFQKLSD